MVGSGQKFQLRSNDAKGKALGKNGGEILTEERLLQWLEDPLKCPDGSLIDAPQMSVDSMFWKELSPKDSASRSFPLQATRLRTHPYEFFPKFIETLKFAELSNNQNVLH